MIDFFYIVTCSISINLNNIIVIVLSFTFQITIIICVTVVINVIFANVGPVFVKNALDPTMVCNFILSQSQNNVVQVFVCGFSGSFPNASVFADLMLLFKIVIWDAIV